MSQVNPVLFIYGTLTYQQNALHYPGESVLILHHIKQSETQIIMEIISLQQLHHQRSHCRLSNIFIIQTATRKCKNNSGRGQFS